MQYKKKQYALFIKMMHQPSVDEEKAKELQNRVKDMRHPVKQSVKVPPGTQLKLYRPNSQKVFRSKDQFSPEKQEINNLND